MLAQLELFFIALSFFTRLPVPRWVDYAPEKLARAARYLPWVGWIVGLAGVSVYWLALQFFSVDLALVLSMAATIRLTGAFHEDGWADTCDGLGGGWDRQQVLAIMKDSRIGSYGAIGLLLLLLAKFIALGDLAAEEDYPLIAALLVAHALSRLVAVALMATLDYARHDDSAKAAPVAQRPGVVDLSVAGVGGVLPLLLLTLPEALVVLGACGLVFVLARRKFMRRLGGYTGDTLGAAQQMAELSIYLGILATWSFI